MRRKSVKETSAKTSKLSKAALPPPGSNQPVPITRAESDALQTAFDHLNQVLFDGMLPNVAIHYECHAHSGGHFSPDRFTYRGNGETEHQIVLNPNGFTGKSDEFIVSILLHEMCHLWQHLFGNKAKMRKRFNYHDREWSLRMQELGLMPSNTGNIGGRITGQRMSHFVVPGGRYAQAFATLQAGGWRLRLESTVYRGADKKKADSKTAFTCATCAARAWGKPDSALLCEACLLNEIELAGLGTIEGLVELLRSSRMLPQQATAADNVASYDAEFGEAAE